MKTMTKLAIGFTATVGIYALVAGEGFYEDCDRIIHASDANRWIDENGGQVDYTGGKWYDKTGKLIGTSATEDSDICAK